MRDGAEYFTAPAGAAQRRYEALRAYFLDEMPAAEVADRFGYSTASIHQMATLLRKGRLNLFTQARPGPKGPRKATGQLRARALELRAAGHSVTEIAAALTGEGMPVSAQTVWQILDAEGLPRLPRRDEGRRGPPARLDPVKAAALPGWPAAPLSLPCDHAGLLLLLPAHDRSWPAGPDQPGRIPLHQGSVVVAVDRHAAAGQMRPQAPRLPRRDAGRRRRAGVHPRADRPAQGHPPGHLLLAYPPRRQPETTVRAGHGAAATGAGHRRERVQLRLPRHPPPRRPGRAGKALRAPPLPAHPRRADLLRPGPRLSGHGVLQRRHHQGRAGQPRSSPSPTTGSRPPAATPGCWSSTPS